MRKSHRALGGVEAPVASTLSEVITARIVTPEIAAPHSGEQNGQGAHLIPVQAG